MSSFTSVSLDPPLILVCIDRGSDTHEKILEARGFGISVLAVDQAGVASRFGVDPSVGRFDGVGWHMGPSGCPLLEGAAAWLECDLHEVHYGGDHSIILGLVRETGVTDEPSMVYHQGAFGSVGP